MTLARIVLKSLRQHALSTVITAVSLALAGGLLMSVWTVKEQSRSVLTQMNGGFDAVLGARSSKLQLVLNAVFHLEASPANIHWEDYEAIRDDPAVALAVPVAMGDNYRGYRIVGTSAAMFEGREFAPGRVQRVRAPGRWFDPELKEAVLGSFAAQRLGLKLGDTFEPYHGLAFNEFEQHEDEYLVVGIMEPSNTPADRVIWIPLAGIQHMSGHADESADELSAVLLKFHSPIAGQSLDRRFNREGERLTLAWPIDATMAGLLSKVGWIDQVLALVASLVGLVATGSVLASIYNSMNERRRQIALLRALGARRLTVFGIVVLEAVAIAVLGMLLAFPFYAGVTAAAAAAVRATTGVVLNPFAWNAVMAWAPLGLIALSGLAGLVPAWKAYRTDVADHLAPAD